MNRKQILLVALTAVLVAVAGIAVWRLLSPAPGLSTPIEMVDIQPGEFLMGSPTTEVDREDNERPQHPVKITYAFKMGKTEVTQKQWREVMGTTIRQQRDKAQDRSSLGKRLKMLGKDIKDNPFGTFDEIQDEGMWKTIKAVAAGRNRWPLYGEGDDYPMYWVNWGEATEFCQKLTELERVAGRLPPGQEYRLPAEAEWEYACRAGSITRFANGNTEAELDKIGWYGGNSGATHPVGAKIPNAWGLHDLHGNVWEWCLDWYGDYSAEESFDPFGPATGTDQIARGGGWDSSFLICRSAERTRCWPSFRGKYLGFRVVLAPVRPRE